MASLACHRHVSRTLVQKKLRAWVSFGKKNWASGDGKRPFTVPTASLCLCCAQVFLVFKGLNSFSQKLRREKLFDTSLLRITCMEKNDVLFSLAMQLAQNQSTRRPQKP